MSMMSPREVAEYTGLSPRAIYRAIDKGELRAAKLCSRLRIDRLDVEEWILDNRVTPATSDTAPPLYWNHTRAAAPTGSLRAQLADG